MMRYASDDVCTRVAPYNFYLADDIEWLGQRLHYCTYRHIFSKEKRNRDKGKRDVEELLSSLTE